MTSMATYFGTKVVMARQMTRQAYNDYRGWKLPENENGSDPGFLIEYVDGGAPNDPRHAGYISWSPRDVFERAYRPTTGLTFGAAIEAVKIGKCVARAGWNGAGQFVYLVPAGSHLAQTEAQRVFGIGAIVPHRAYLALKTAQGDIATWAPSGSDALADDWIIL